LLGVIPVAQHRQFEDIGVTVHSLELYRDRFQAVARLDGESRGGFPRITWRGGRSRWCLQCIARSGERRGQATGALLLAPRLSIHPAARSQSPPTDAGDR